MIRANRIGKGLTLSLLLAVAAVMLGGCSDKLKKENEALKVENLELRDRLAASQSELAMVQTERNDLLETVSRLEGEVAAAKTSTTTVVANPFGGIGGGIEVEQGSRGEVIVRVPGDVLFSSGKVTLKSSAKQTLARIAGVLKREYSGNTIRVEGYSDSDPIRKSPWKTNLRLSAERAMAVHEYLASQGVDKERMYAAGFGATNFRASNSTSAGKAQNRRVEIVVVMD